MDEAYSYGYNNTRDASTITPRKEVQHLVMPDDLKELPSLHGFIEFPDGFPAAKIKLEIVNYPVVAKDYERVTIMRAAEFKPAPDDEMEEPGTGGHEEERGDEDAQIEEQETPASSAAVSEAEHPDLQREQASNLAQIASAPKIEPTPKLPAEGSSVEMTRSLPGSSAFRVGSAKTDSDAEDQRDPDRLTSSTPTDTKAASSRLGISKPEQQPSMPTQESQITREQREGIGTEEQQKDGPDIGDDLEPEM